LRNWWPIEWSPVRQGRFWLCTTFHGWRFAWAAGRTGSPFYLSRRPKTRSRCPIFDSRYFPQAVPGKERCLLRFDFRSDPRFSILSIIARPAARAAVPWGLRCARNDNPAKHLSPSATFPRTGGAWRRRGGGLAFRTCLQIRRGLFVARGPALAACP